MAEPLPRFLDFAGQVPTPEEFAAAASYEMAFAHLLRGDIPRCRQSLAETVAHGAGHAAIEELRAILEGPNPLSRAARHLVTHSWLVPLPFRATSVETALRLVLMGHHDLAETVLTLGTDQLVLDKHLSPTHSNRVKRWGRLGPVLAALHPFMDRPDYPRLRSLYIDALEVGPDVSAYMTAIDRIIGPEEKRQQDIRWLSLQVLRGHAADVLGAVLHLYGAQPDIHVSRLLAQVFVDLRQFHEAAAVLHEAEASFPAWYFAPVRCLLALYRNDQAEAERQSGAFSLFPAPDRVVTSLKAMMLGRRGLWREAEETVSATAASLRNDACLLVSLSVIHHRLGNEAAAAEAEACAQAVDPAWSATEHARWRSVLSG